MIDSLRVLLLTGLGLLAGCFAATIEPGSLRCQLDRATPCPGSLICLPEYAGATIGRCYPPAAADDAGTPANIPAGLVWEATAGEVVAPFQAASDAISISQAIPTTEPSQGGRATYEMNLAAGGSFVVEALVLAPSANENSLFVNIDADPSSAMLWDAPVEQAFAWRAVTWRESRIAEDIPPAPKVFHLLAGPHALIVRGHDANVQLARLCLLPYMPPPAEL